ncbi:MAG: proline iminopeptidase-family hydrolase [Thermoanaerobaculia bacterium]
MCRVVPVLLALTWASIAFAAKPAPMPSVFPIDEGYVEGSGALIYYKAFGKGDPLVIVHGGPGASHDYLLPHLIPLARTNRLVFIDERGSGRSERLDDAKQYTVETMADDVEAVRKHLSLGKINLLGHSYGGVLAQAYALKYPQNLRHLILASTFHSTKGLNAFFETMKKRMPEELRNRIDAMEKAGLFGQGKDFRKGRYTDDYMTAAWGEGYYPYTYGRKPDANFDPVAGGAISWDLYREMWGSHGEFVVDGNLVSVEYAGRLPSIKVPTLIAVGDHDQVDPSIAREMNGLIKGSKLVILPNAGHMTFVDQPVLFRKAVDDFVHGRP